MIDIARITRPKNLPIRTVCLSKIDENMPSHDTLCLCDMCHKYQSRKVSQLLQQQTLNLNNKIHSKTVHKHGIPTASFYMWVIKHLMIPHNKIISRGIDIFVPEIVFYKEGQPNKMYCSKQVDDPCIKMARKQKLSSTFLLKIFGDRRRKYKEVINSFLGRKKQIITKKSFYGQKKQIKKQAKDGVIIKYTDNLQQLISENQFLYLLQRRKQDPLWKQIKFIKNYIPVDDPLTRIFTAKFEQNDIKFQQLFKRSSILMRVYSKNIVAGDRQYISQKQQSQFCKELLKSSIQNYCQYNLYKIVNFVEYFHDQKILNLSVKFIVNQMSQIYLEDVMKLETKQLIKFQWTNQVYLRKIDEEQQRVFFSKQVKMQGTAQQNSENIQKQMGKTYEKMKQHFGLSMEQEDDTQQKANNTFFKLIHPQIQTPISEILKNSNVTVEKFKKDYLGFKPKKKPLVRPFTSNMIKSLHKMTPQFQRTDPHQFVKIPKRSVSTAFSRSSSYKTKSFSQHKNLSFNSTAFTTSFSSPRVLQLPISDNLS